jgi:hypothetical protein
MINECDTVFVRRLDQKTMIGTLSKAIVTDMSLYRGRAIFGTDKTGGLIFDAETLRQICGWNMPSRKIYKTEEEATNDYDYLRKVFRARELQMDNNLTEAGRKLLKELLEQI